MLPALCTLTGQDGQGFSLRVAFGNAEESLEGLAAGHHDLAIGTARPQRGALLAATALCDEEHVLVAAPRWAERLGHPHRLRESGAAALDGPPVVEVHESLPLVVRYWASGFETPPTHRRGPGLRAGLACAVARAGLTVLPRHLCAAAVAQGELIILLEPPVAPLRTYFLAIRTRTLAMPHIARTHEWLLHSAVKWC